jgi:hypothetical protein
MVNVRATRPKYPLIEETEISAISAQTLEQSTQLLLLLSSMKG